MAGGLGCLGVLLDVSVRVVPVPRVERSLRLDIPLGDATDRLTALMRCPLPLSGAFHDGAGLHIRLAGAQAGVTQAAREIGGEDESPDIWQDMRHLRLSALAAARLWRIAVPRTAGPLALEGGWLHDWAGGQRWLVTDATADQVRAAAVAAGGHATLFRGAGSGEDVFTHLPAPMLALHQRLKAAFDPAGIFNPGRMYKDL